MALSQSSPTLSRRALSTMDDSAAATTDPDTPKEKPKFFSYSFKIRDVVLGLLVLQSTSIVLLMRYSKTYPRGTIEYRSSVAVLLAEAIKLPFCLLMIALTCGGARELVRVLRADVLGNLTDTLKCAVPAVAYTLQGNLLFVALANLEAPTYQVTYQSKTLLTALFSFLILGRRLKPSQWLGVVLLVAGTVAASDLSQKSAGHRGRESPAKGLAAVLSAAILSASSSVYFEKMLKKPSMHAAPPSAALWVRNVQLGAFALPLAAIAVAQQDGTFVPRHGLLAGFDSLVWVIVLLNGCGGLLVAATMKYADNVVKCFAAALAILSGTLLSVPIFGFAPSPGFALGAALTIGASVLYAAAPDWGSPPPAPPPPPPASDVEAPLVEKK